jgi:hypothetical protein
VLAHRKALLQRALTTATAALVASTTTFAGAASADHPAHEECRMWAPHPHPFVKVVAQDDTFDTDCIVAPGNRRFRIYLENRDRTSHNLSIYTADPSKDEGARKVFAGGEVGDRGRTDYAIGSLEPGEYFFQDDNVPGMNGTVLVEADEK